MRILKWLTFSARPLLIEEVAEVVAIDVARDPAFDRDEVLEDPLEALNICSSLVTISTIQAKERLGPAQQIVNLAHYSVQEYLVSARLQKHERLSYFALSEVESHQYMTQLCCAYFLQFTMQPEVDEWIKHPPEFIDPYPVEWDEYTGNYQDYLDDFARDYSLLPYVTNTWFFHQQSDERHGMLATNHPSSGCT